MSDQDDFLYSMHSQIWIGSGERIAFHRGVLRVDARLRLGRKLQGLIGHCGTLRGASTPAGH